MVFEPVNVIECKEISNDVDEEESDIVTESDPVRYRSGRPKIIRTGKPGRPRKLQQVQSLAQSIVNTPETVTEAVTSYFREEWLQSMKHEYDNLMRNSTYMVFSRSPEGLASNRLEVGF